jgi:hypothetical protein
MRMTGHSLTLPAREVGHYPDTFRRHVPPTRSRCASDLFTVAGVRPVAATTDATVIGGASLNWRRALI